MNPKEMFTKKKVRELPAKLPRRPKDGWKWHLLGLSLGALLAVCVAPRTRMMATTIFSLTVRGLYHIPHYDPEHGHKELLEACDKIVRERRDVEMQIAAPYYVAQYAGEYSPSQEIQGAQDLVKETNLQFYLDRTVKDNPLRPDVYALSLACTARRMLHYTLLTRMGDTQKRQREIDTQQIIQTALRQARVGEHLEPNNSYFPLMEAQFHVFDNDWAGAVAALERASNKSSFNDYQIILAKGRYRVSRALVHLPEDFPSVFQPSEYELDWKPLTGLYIAVMRSAVTQERRGNIAAAVALRGALMRFAVTMRNNADSIYDRRVAAALFQNIAEDDDIPESLLNQPMRKYSDLTDMAEKFRSPYFRPLNLKYLNRLRASGFSDEAEWYKQQTFKNGSLAKPVDQRSAVLGQMNGNVFVAMMFMTAAVFLTVFGGMALLRRYRNRFSCLPAYPPPPSLFKGTLCALFLTLSPFVLQFLFLENERLQSISLFSSLLICLTLVSVAVVRRYRYFLKGFVMTLLRLLLMIALTVWTGMGFNAWDNTFGVSVGNAEHILILTLIVLPLLSFMIIAWMVQGLRRKEARFTESSALAAIAVPSVAVCIFLFVCSVLSAVPQHELANMLVN